MKDYFFYVHVFENGGQRISSISLKNEYSLLYLILDQIGHNSKEMNSFRLRIIESRKKMEKVLVSYNTLYLYVDGETSELGENDYKESEFQAIPTDLILSFIEDAIRFHKLYNSGNIPGIIPESKKEEWLIVPKEFVKEEYYKSNS